MKKKITFQNILLIVLAILAAYRFTFLTDENKQRTSAGMGQEEFQIQSLSSYDLSSYHIPEENVNSYVISELCKSNRYVFKVSKDGLNPEYEKMYDEVMPGIFEEDNGRTVLHAVKDINSPGWLCNNISEITKDLPISYQGNLNWKIKPVMKINKSDYSPDDTIKVVAIVAKNLSGIVIDSLVLRVFNFGDRELKYNGEYTQEYLSVCMQLQGNPDSANSLFYSDQANGIRSVKKSKIDFKVYWFGLVDVWFDKMILDDTRADELFGKDNAGNYDCKIRDAATMGNYLYMLNIIKENKYTTSSILPINYVMKIMKDELIKKNILPNEVALAQ
jgi:hypothetical protein